MELPFRFLSVFHLFIRCCFFVFFLLQLEMEVAASLLQWPKYLQSRFLHSFTAFTAAVWGGGKSEERPRRGRGRDEKGTRRGQGGDEEGVGKRQEGECGEVSPGPLTHALTH